MKKVYSTIVMLAMIVAALSSAQAVNAQSKDWYLILSAGLSGSNCDKVLTEPKLGIHYGIDVQKNILHYPNEASAIFGLIGIHLDMKGGESSGGSSITGYYGRIPLHAGFSYQFSKVSVFIDLGPHISIRTSDSKSTSNSKPNKTEFGYGVNMGVKFRKFGISIGEHKGLTNFATYGDTKLKNSISNIDLRWYF